ncbi:transposase [Pantoea stewartii]|uniref:transposase n=1 Tax=Pantoea stewartii TaxID=66269 RepID=UPI0030BA0218
MKSVGLQQGMHMLVELRRYYFESADQAAAFLYVVPFEKRSGTSLPVPPRMSKIGPPQLRSRLYMSSLCGIIHKNVCVLSTKNVPAAKPKIVAIG